MCQCSKPNPVLVTPPDAGVGGDKIVRANCDFWSSEDFKWCYLANTSNVDKCPGAEIDADNNVYWTKHDAVCKGI